MAAPKPPPGETLDRAIIVLDELSGSAGTIISFSRAGEALAEAGIDKTEHLNVLLNLHADGKIVRNESSQNLIVQEGGRRRVRDLDMRDKFQITELPKRLRPLRNRLDELYSRIRESRPGDEAYHQITSRIAQIERIIDRKILARHLWISSGAVLVAAVIAAVAAIIAAGS